jgi:hypothetical protein
MVDEDALTKLIQDQATKTAEEIRAAGKRVGVSAKDQLRWALNFSNRDVSDPSLGTVLDLFLELFAFQKLSDAGGGLKLPDSISFPEKEGFTLFASNVKETHRLFNQVLLSYLRNRRFDIENDGRTTFILTPQGFSSVVENPVMDCTVKLMRLIGEFPEHVHQCPEDHATEMHSATGQWQGTLTRRVCGNWFLADRKDAVFCSKTCAGRKRISAFRKYAKSERDRLQKSRKRRETKNAKG